MESPVDVCVNAPLPLGATTFFLVAFFMVKNGCSRLRNLAFRSHCWEERSPEVEEAQSRDFYVGAKVPCCEFTGAVRKMRNLSENIHVLF